MLITKRGGKKYKDWKKNILTQQNFQICLMYISKREVTFISAKKFKECSKCVCIVIWDSITLSISIIYIYIFKKNLTHVVVIFLFYLLWCKNIVKICQNLPKFNNFFSFFFQCLRKQSRCHRQSYRASHGEYLVLFFSSTICLHFVWPLCVFFFVKTSFIYLIFYVKSSFIIPRNFKF